MVLFKCFGREEKAGRVSTQPKTQAGAGMRRSKSSIQVLSSPSLNSKNPLYQASAPAPPSSSSNVSSPPSPLPFGLSQELMGALCFSMAVLSSDSTDVLYHNCGSESAAAQLLQTVLSKVKHSKPGGEPPSVLSLLLGKELQAEAEEALAQGRPWRCTICVSLASRPSTTSTMASGCLQTSKSKQSNASIGGPVQAPSGPETLDACCSSAANAGDVSAEAGVHHCEAKISNEPMRTSRSEPLEVYYDETVETDECSRTAVLLKELSEAGKLHSSKALKSLSGRRATLPEDDLNDEDECEDSPELATAEGPPAVQSPQLSTTTSDATPLQPAPSGMNDNSFDICVSRAPTNDGGAAPVVVSIHNSTEHGKTKAALSTLSETQLELLSGIMPLHAIQFLAKESMEAVPANIAQLARRHQNATLLFLDIAGFTSFSGDVDPEHVMILLNSLFSAFDSLTDECHVNKLETAGDCYLVCGGVLSTCPSAPGFNTLSESKGQDPAEAAKRVMNFAIKALKAASTVTMPGTDEPVRVRIGIHTGDCVSGLIGAKLPKFSLFGDAMNVASRMESTGKPGHIHVSEATYRLLQHEHCWKPTGGVKVKGKGEMQTYLWESPSQADLSNMWPQRVEARAASAPNEMVRKFSTLLQHVNVQQMSLQLPIVT